MTKEQTVPTKGEMERNLSQYIQAFYRQQLGCRVGKIDSYILSDRVAIFIENSITPLEHLLDNSSDREFRRDLRDRLDAIIKQELLLAMETILQVRAIDLIINTTLSNNFTGIIVLLADMPTFRNTKRSSRVRN